MLKLANIALALRLCSENARTTTTGNLNYEKCYFLMQNIALDLRLCSENARRKSREDLSLIHI